MSGAPRVQAEGAIAFPPTGTFVRLGARLRRTTRWLVREVIEAPVEPVLNATRGRLIGLGISALAGHPLYFFIWSVWLPQPYENPWARASVAICALPLLIPRVNRDPQSRQNKAICTVVFWIGLPFFFGWMYWMNGGNEVWLASVVAMIFIYFYATDWRIACIGVLTGGVASWIFALWTGAGPSVENPFVALVLVAFALVLGAVLGMSTASIGRSRIEGMTATVGIMAHELRTPLATMAMIGEAMRADAADPEPVDPQRLALLAARLQTLVRGMNHHIDLQIANARLMRLPAGGDAIDAAALIEATVREYPFRSTEERDCVRIEVLRNFHFRGSTAQFEHVIDNLLKNALRSLAARDLPLSPGDLRIVVGARARTGTIEVIDRGLGVAPELAPRVFEPFFSTDRSTGHGLGLAYCLSVARGAGGDIRFDRKRRDGAAFCIEVPILVQ